MGWYEEKTFSITCDLSYRGYSTRSRRMAWQGAGAQKHLVSPMSSSERNSKDGNPEDGTEDKTDTRGKNFELEIVVK